MNLIDLLMKLFIKNVNICYMNFYYDREDFMVGHVFF